MKQFVDFLKTTILGGFFVILPIALVVFLLGEILGIAVGLVDPIAAMLPVEEVGGIGVARILAVVLVLGLCFVAGLIVRTDLGRRGLHWLESVILGRLPGYDLVKSLTGRFEPGHQGTVALVRIHPGEATVPAFVVEELGDGRVVVFVPLTPTPTIGNLYVIPRQDVRALPASTVATLDMLTRWGLGAREVLEPERA